MEEAQFGVSTFGKTPEEAAAARRTLELSRLGPEGFSQAQTSLLSELMVQRDELIRALEKLREEPAIAGRAAPGATHVDITINGNVNNEEDAREIARRVTAVLEGQTAPPN